LNGTFKTGPAGLCGLRLLWG